MHFFKAKIRVVQRLGKPNPPAAADWTRPAVDRRLNRLVRRLTTGLFLQNPSFPGRVSVFLPPKSVQPDPTNPENFLRYLVDPARSIPFLSRSWRDFAGSSPDLAKNGLDQVGFGETSRILAFFLRFHAGFLPDLRLILTIFQIFDPDRPARILLEFQPARSDHPLGRRRVEISSTQSDWVGWAQTRLGPTHGQPQVNLWFT